LHKVCGTGETGPAFHSFTWPGLNNFILTAMPDDEADRMVEGLKPFRDYRRKHQHGTIILLRVFVLPCAMVV
jgi:hypothetical protein